MTAHRAALVFVLLAFGALAYLIVPPSPGGGKTVSVVRSDMDALQQCLVIGDGMDKIAGKALSYYDTAILYPDRTQLRSTEPFLGYVLLGLPLRVAGFSDVHVFELERCSACRSRSSWRGSITR